MAIADKEMLLKVQAFHDNALTASESAAMREQLMADPALRDVLKGMELTSQSARAAFDVQLEDVDWSGMTESILASVPTLQSAPNISGGGFFVLLGRGRLRQWLLVGAAACFALGAYALLSNGASQLSGETPSIATPGPVKSGVAMEPVVLKDEGDTIIFMDESDEQGGEL